MSKIDLKGNSDAESYFVNMLNIVSGADEPSEKLTF